MSITEPALSVRNLRTQFTLPSGGVLTAVDDVSFDLERGESLGIVGESGSGKSTLARTIMRLIPREASVTGSIQFGGRELNSLSTRQIRPYWGKQISMVFQDPMTSLNPVRRIGSQIVDPLRQHLGLSGADARRRALNLLDQVRIPDPLRRMKQYPFELSGGMRQRVAIAIALSCDPAIVIADEPSTALDVTVQKQILDLLASLQEDTGMSLIMISHDLGMVAGRTSRTSVMYAGRLVEMAGTEELFRSPRHRYSEALLASLPDISKPPHSRLVTIPGRTPNLANLPAGCRFVDRCQHKLEVCSLEQPKLIAEEIESHKFACFNPADTILVGER